MAVLSLVLQTWDLGLAFRATWPKVNQSTSHGPPPTSFRPLCWVLSLFVHICLKGRYGEQLSCLVSSRAYLAFLDNIKLSFNHSFYVSVSPLALFSHPFLLLTILPLGPPTALQAPGGGHLKLSLRAYLSRHEEVASYRSFCRSQSSLMPVAGTETHSPSHVLWKPSLRSP